MMMSSDSNESFNDADDSDSGGDCAGAIYENICDICCHCGRIFGAAGRYCKICHMLNGQLTKAHELQYENNIFRTLDQNSSQDAEYTEYDRSSKRIRSETPKQRDAFALKTRPENSTHLAESKFELKSKVFGDILEAFRKPRFLSSKSKRDAKKPRKLEIIHNVANITDFEEARYDELRTSEKKHTTSSHVQSYGIDHQSRWLRSGRCVTTTGSRYCGTGEQLLSTTRNTKNKYRGICSPKHTDTYHCDSTNTRFASPERNARKAIVVYTTHPVFSSDKYDNVTTRPAPHVPLRSQQVPSLVQDNNNVVVLHWLTSLRRQTHSYCEPDDDSISIIKSIPSPSNFNCCGLLCGHPIYKSDIGSGLVSPISLNSSWLRSEQQLAVQTVFICDVGAYLNVDDDESLCSGSNNPRAKLMIERFKHQHHLMEKQLRSKRRAIYVKIDEDSDDCVDESDVSSSSTLDNDRGGCRTKRNAFHERNSEFVNDMLSVFNSLLSSDKDETSAPDCSTPKKTSEHLLNQPEISTARTNSDAVTRLHRQASTANAGRHFACSNTGTSSPFSRIYYRNEISRTIFKGGTHIPIAHSILRTFVTAVGVSKSLNGFLLTIDNSSSLRQMLSLLARKPNFLKEDRATLEETFLTNFIVVPWSETKKSKNLCPIGNDTDDHNHMNGKDLTTRVPSEDDDIYQHIWTFRSVGNPRESYASSIDLADEIIVTEDSDYVNTTGVCSDDSLSLSVKDLSDWETDDEFIFSHSCAQNNLQQRKNFHLKEQTVSGDLVPPTSSPRLAKKIRTLKPLPEKSTGSCHSLSSIGIVKAVENPPDYMPDRKYERVCILYSLEDSHVRAIIYNNAGSRQDHLTDQNIKNKIVTGSPSSAFVESYLQEQDIYKKTATNNGGHEKNRNNIHSFIHIDSVPRCVQAWKFTLLSAYYSDDEEDMYISRNEILNSYRNVEAAPTLLKKCASEGNLLQLPRDKKKTLGERLLNKVQAVSIFPISPRQIRDKRKLDFLKRRGSNESCSSNNVKKGLLFGANLSDMKITGISNVPEFVVDCIKFIEQPAHICTDGLYRASGNKLEIDILKKNLTDRYDTKILENQDIHTITGLLKLFFRELKTALISDEIYNKLPNNLTNEENLWSIKNVLYIMSSVSKETLKYLIKHLTRVAAESHQNRMPASNLAIIWGPCILYSSFTTPMSIARINTLTKILIEQYDFIFEHKDERYIG